MRKFLVAVVMMVGIIFIITQFAELENIVETLQRGDARFLLMALAIQGFWLLNVAMLYRAIYQTMGIDESLKQMCLIAAAANFVNVVTPTAGVGGMAVFIAEARRKGYSRGRTTVAATVFVLFDYAGFFIVLALGLIVLIRRDKLQMAEVIASAILLAIACVLALLLYLGMYSEQLLGRFLAWMARMVNQIVRPLRTKKSGDYLSTKRAYTFAHDVAEGMRALRRNPNDLVLPMILALSGKVLLMIVMMLIFMAFEVSLSAGTLIAGFSVAFLFMIVSPTPSGVGFVEGALTLTLVSFYIPLSDAAVVALAYRGITFWTPLIFGMLALRWIGGLEQPAPI